jgi:hypothetical protein
MKTVRQIIPAKLSKIIRKVEIGEDGVMITMHENVADPEQMIFIDVGQLEELWGVLTISIDTLREGKFAGMIRSTGLWAVIENMTRKVRTVVEKSSQLEIKLESGTENGL